MKKKDLVSAGVHTTLGIWQQEVKIPLLDFGQSSDLPHKVFDSLFAGTLHNSRRVIRY